MFETHIDEKSLHEKIISLFDYRLFPQLLQYGGKSDDENKEFYQNLIDLQTAIYHLDAHLEAHWDTDNTKLAWHWDNIKSKLNVFNIDNELSIAYLNHIKKYEKHELELRAGKTPLRLDMEYFYFYKSCDVKLLRRLIYESLRLSPQCGKLSDWRYYDLVTEVNDDVEDLFEDLDFINGNRFLISLLFDGKKETAKVFLAFLNTIKSNAKEKYALGAGSFRSEILEQTLLRAKETEQLLHAQLEKVSIDDLQRAKLLPYLKVKMTKV
jgi:hypothetical protein